MPTDVVTAFLRSRGEVLLLRRSDAVGTYRGRWGGVSGYAEGDPDDQVRREIAEETGLEDAVEFVRSGRPLQVEDDDRTWRVHPSLFECSSRTVTLSEEHTDHTWVSPTTIHLGERPCVPGLWAAYERVAPSVRTVAADADHGADYLSVRALEVLRDRAAVLAAAGEDGSDELADLAERLASVRPSMAVLRNRIDRAMATAPSLSAPAVHEATLAGIDSAVEARAAVAGTLADQIEGTAMTLSRSGTVLEGIRQASLDRVYVAESRPDREGVGVAEALAGDVPVTLHTDAAVATILERESVDIVVVGADTILPDGAVVNKTGTRGLAIAAAHEDVPVVVAAARDKVAPTGEVNLESGTREPVYDGSAALDVANPTFDVTPASLVDRVLTEAGPLTDIDAVATEHASNASWRSEG